MTTTPVVDLASAAALTPALKKVLPTWFQGMDTSALSADEWNDLALEVLAEAKVTVGTPSVLSAQRMVPPRPFINERDFQALSAEFYRLLYTLWETGRLPYGGGFDPFNDRFRDSIYDSGRIGGKW